MSKTVRPKKQEAVAVAKAERTEVWCVQCGQMHPIKQPTAPSQDRTTEAEKHSRWYARQTFAFEAD
jgi:hypothetical protein